MEARLLRVGLSRIRLAAWGGRGGNQDLASSCSPLSPSILKAYLPFHDNNEEFHLEADQVS